MSGINLINDVLGFDPFIDLWQVVADAELRMLMEDDDFERIFVWLVGNFINRLLVLYFGLMK